MFDIIGVPPFQQQERKVTSRNTQAEATDYAKNLASHGYKNLRVVDANTPPVNPQPNPGPTPAPKPVVPHQQTPQTIQQPQPGQPVKADAPPAPAPQGGTPPTPAEQDAPGPHGQK